MGRGRSGAGRAPAACAAAVIRAREKVTPAPRRLDERVWTTQLADGPQVLSECLEGVRSVALGLWFRQGAAMEKPEERGISHLLEHMAFKGTRSRSARELTLAVERIGGAVDAYTTHEVTAFVARVPYDALERAVDVVADLAFRPALRARDLAPERKVILEEISSLQDTPEELVFELHAQFLYGAHPYGATILGAPETIAAVNHTSLRRLHRASYRGGNAVVTAAGRVDHGELVELVRRLAPSGPAAGRQPLPPVRQAAIGHRRVERPGGRQIHIVAGGVTVPYAHPLRHALVLVETAFGAGMSSRLFQRMREELGLAYNVYSFHTFHEHGGHAGAYVGTGPETAEEAREALLEELRRLAESGLTPSEIETTKEQLTGQLMLSLESPASRMRRLAGLALYDEPYRTLDEVAQRIAAVTEDEVREAAAYFHPDRLAVLELAPA